MTPDVNVLIAASRSDHPHHRTALRWLQDALAGSADGNRFVLLPMVVAEFLRLVTHPKVFVSPTPMSDACAFIDAILAAPGVRLAPLGEECQPLLRLCRSQKLHGNAVPDAWIASAVKIAGAHLVTFDRGFSRLLGRNDYTLLTA